MHILISIRCTDALYIRKSYKNMQKNLLNHYNSYYVKLF